MWRCVAQRRFLGLLAMILFLYMNAGCMFLTNMLWEGVGPESTRTEKLTRVVMTKGDVAYLTVRYSNGDLVHFRARLAIEPGGSLQNRVQLLASVEVMSEWPPEKLIPGRGIMILKGSDQELVEKGCRPNFPEGVELIFGEIARGDVTIYASPLDHYGNGFTINWFSPYEWRTVRLLFCAMLTPLTAAVDVVSFPLQVIVIWIYGDEMSAGMGMRGGP